MDSYARGEYFEGIFIVLTCTRLGDFLGQFWNSYKL